jgi:hypothetical protein
MLTFVNWLLTQFLEPDKQNGGTAECAMGNVVWSGCQMTVTLQSVLIDHTFRITH